MSYFFTQLSVFILWLLHWLPLSVLSRVGEALGEVLYVLAAPRRKVVHINLRLCFPELSDEQRRRMARAHFRATTRSILERGILWWGSAERIRRTVTLSGTEHIAAAKAAGKPIILLAPHFVGLDMGGTRITMDYDIVSIYSMQNNPILNHWLLHGRSRFGNQLLLSRQDGVRHTVKGMKEGRPFYYLPDMDYGPKDSVFVPFFGVSTATITGLSRLAKMAGAVVIPCITTQRPGGGGYHTRCLPAWPDFPSADAVADTAYMNQQIEQWIAEQPEQYYWVHKRFKTRPPGDPRFY